jgi:hypothetical protein
VAADEGHELRRLPRHLPGHVGERGSAGGPQHAAPHDGGRGAAGGDGGRASADGEPPEKVLRWAPRPHSALHRAGEAAEDSPARISSTASYSTHPRRAGVRGGARGDDVVRQTGVHVRRAPQASGRTARKCCRRDRGRARRASPSTATSTRTTGTNPCNLLPSGCRRRGRCWSG